MSRPANPVVEGTIPWSMSDWISDAPSRSKATSRIKMRAQCIIAGQVRARTLAPPLQRAIPSGKSEACRPDLLSPAVKTKTPSLMGQSQQVVPKDEMIKQNFDHLFPNDVHVVEFARYQSQLGSQQGTPSPRRGVTVCLASLAACHRLRRIRSRGLIFKSIGHGRTYTFTTWWPRQTCTNTSRTLSSATAGAIMSPTEL